MDSPKKNHDVDQWLEPALNQYGKAEPRAGLEGRVLARLHLERTRIALKRRWCWAAGMAAAAAGILVVLWLGHRNPPTQPNHREAAQVMLPSVRQPEVAPRKEQIARDAPSRRRIPRMQFVDTPKLAQFPAPRKLSKQEMLLMRYLQTNPNAAVLAQTITHREAADLDVRSIETTPLAIPDLVETQSENN